MQINDKIGKYLTSGRSWYTRWNSSIKKLVVHHSAIPGNLIGDDLLKKIYSIHSSKDWPGLSYHYVIDSNGQIFQCNRHTWITWHDSINDDSLGILVHGYFHPDKNEKPNQKQLDSLKWLLDKLCTEHPEFPADHDDVLGHRDRKATACPGDNLYPYVKEYREKKGEVNWSTTEQPKIYTEEEYTKVRLERDDNWNKYQKTLKHLQETQADYEEQKSIAEKRKQDYQAFKEDLARKLVLPAASDTSDLLGAVDRLLAVEEQKRILEKKLVELEKKHQEEIKQVKEEAQSIKESLEKLSEERVNENKEWEAKIAKIGEEREQERIRYEKKEATLMDRIERLEDELEDKQEQKGIFDWIKDLFSNI